MASTAPVTRKKLTPTQKNEIRSVDPHAASEKEASAFLQEVFKNAILHGPVIGVVQQINLNFDQETTIFFTDGFAFMSAIPLIGIDITQKPQYKWNLLVMKKILMTIFGLGDMIEGDYICKRGTPEEMEEPQSFGNTCYFVFRPPETGNINYSECLGIWLLDNHIGHLANDSACALMPEVGAF